MNVIPKTTVILEFAEVIYVLMSEEVMMSRLKCFVTGGNINQNTYFTYVMLKMQLLQEHFSSKLQGLMRS